MWASNAGKALSVLKRRDVLEIDTDRLLQQMITVVNDATRATTWDAVVKADDSDDLVNEFLAIMPELANDALCVCIQMCKAEKALGLLKRQGEFEFDTGRLEAQLLAVVDDQTGANGWEALVSSSSPLLYSGKSVTLKCGKRGPKPNPEIKA